MFKILVPVDLSEASKNACAYVMQLAAKLPQSQVLLLHSFYDYLADADTTVPATEDIAASEAITERVLYRNETEAQEQFDALYHELKASATASQVQLEHEFVYGLAEEKIEEEVQRYRPDLLVLGTKGESDFMRSFFGTVTTKLVEDMRVPVLTVPQQYTGAAPAKALYATNFDKTDAHAISLVHNLLQPFKASLSCIHISDDDAEENQEKLRALQEKLRASASADDIRFMLLEEDDVADALQDFVKREQVNLLALTTHERGTFSSIFKPSLTKKLVLEVAVPLLVFHSPQKI